MCLNCGCGEPEVRHQDTDITLDDVREASAGKPLEQTIQNLQNSLGELAQGGSSSAGMDQRTV